jgi:hypothetical protein
MRKILVTIAIGLTAVAAAACGNGGSSTAPGDLNTLAPLESPSDMLQSTSPSDMLESPSDMLESPAAS